MTDISMPGKKPRYELRQGIMVDRIRIVFGSSNSVAVRFTPKHSDPLQTGGAHSTLVPVTNICMISEGE